MFLTQEMNIWYTKFTRPCFISHCRHLAGVIHSDIRFYTCVMSLLYPATREQTIYGSVNQTVKQNACDPNSGKYGRGRETTDIERENRDIVFFAAPEFGKITSSF